MDAIQVHDKTFVPYISAADIAEKIKEIASQISKDYEGKRPLFIAVLNGSFIFASDLFRRLNIDAEISFIKLASYKGTTSTGNVITAIGLEESLHQRHVILLEDIIDTGKTLHEFLPQLQHQGPASIEVAALLTKPDALKFPVHPKYSGFEIPNKFVVGYGLDYDGLGRNIPGIYQLG
ncbi:hypoxanthine phosphoribosyltransferase [Taibaiella lutea]|uniref:Hypoxanthine phosphoribosyltransferase n=1 Tax=Taibaiella lutea TaxID=2608001 RepID=A0A5M6CQZ4_9BACT|nr:hypoxanthine phosphoribosyltransferase [Taibaiella lutea]KAA5537386.1 hypoxanthine phosphoribosyltransferase [Taibaiella lutea]